MKTKTLRSLPVTLWFFLDTERWKYLLFLFVLLAVMFYTMVPPLLIGSIANFLIDYVQKPLSQKPSVNQLYLLIGLLAGSSAAVALVRLSAKRMLGKISLNARYRAKVWGFQKLIDHSLAWHQQENTGNKAQRILTGSEAVREWTGDVINQLTQGFASFVGSFIACVLLHPAYALFFVYYIAVLAGIERHFDKKIALLSDRINKSLENASGSFVESASNILAVKALGAGTSMTGTIAEREKLSRELAYERLRLSNQKWMCFQMHNAVSWGAYLVSIGLMAMNGFLLPGFFLTYAAYWDRLRDSSVDFTDKMQVMIERASNLRRMMDIFHAPLGLSVGTESFPQKWDAIHLKNAVFQYQGSDSCFGPVDLEIQRGTKLGIAGHSGSGKSTLVKLMLGLYHLQSGELRIGKNPVAEIDHDELTTNVAVVLQDTELFNVSLRDNITMMREVDPVLLQTACELACLDELLTRLPDGLESIVGEKGNTLSGGERQRVGIARAICRNTPILLLDEASSALDSITEAKVTKGLMDYCKDGRTLIVIAHRTSTLAQTDRIVVFEKGSIVESGAFKDLISKPKGIFAQMHQSQEAQP